MRPIAERHGLTMLQLACAWNLAHEPVACVAPTLIQEPGEDARPIEDKRAELAAVPGPVLSAEEVAEIRAIGDNTGSMALKGAAPGFEGDPLPDRWPLSDELVGAGRPLGDRPPPRPRALGLTQLGGPDEPRTTRLVGSSTLGPGGPELSSRSAATRPLARSAWCTLVRSSLAGAVSSKPTIERSPGTDRPRSRAASRAPSASGSLNANSAVTPGARSSRAWARTRPDSTLLEGLCSTGTADQSSRAAATARAQPCRRAFGTLAVACSWASDAGRSGMRVGREAEAQDREPAVAEVQQVAHRGLRGAAVVDPDEVERVGVDRR